MQLKDYFREQKNTNLSQNEKFFLYEKIISQKDQKNFSKAKRFVNIKSFAYGFAMIILFVSIYWVYFINWDLSYEGFLVKNAINQVNADYIAKVVDFNGDFYIKHDWSYYKTSNISNWDNIILKKWAEIIFDIDKGRKAKITWPARFTLSLQDNNYKLLVSQWDFVQIKSPEDKETKPIDVVINNITVSSKQNTNFQIAKNDNNEYKINNQWDKITITQDNNTRELQTKQLLTINNENNEVTIIKNIEDFGKAITQNNVSQVFTITKNDTNPQVDKEQIQKQIVDTLLNDKNTNDYKITNPELAENLWLVDDKKIPTTDQTKTLHSLLNNNFVMWNIEWIYKSYTAWEDKEYKYNEWLLESRIQKIYKLFDIKYNKNNLIDNIKTLKQKLTSRYNIPSKYTDNLDIIVSRIQYIKTNTYWLTTDIDEINQLWNKLETNPPSNLILK